MDLNQIKELLKDNICELIINSDGKVWIENNLGNKYYADIIFSFDEIERIICIMASAKGLVCNYKNPLLSCEFPELGYRVQAAVYPVVENPIICIRKPSSKIFSLDEIVESNCLSHSFSKILKKAVKNRKNILVAGGTGSGKTTLINALLFELKESEERLIIIEDTKELQVKSSDCVSLKSSDEVSMQQLVKTSLRLRPDRIIIGEVRGREAYDLLKSWNTGHPGGITSIHADSCSKALLRLEQLVSEAGVSNYNTVIKETVDLVVFIEKKAGKRVVSEVLEVKSIA